MEKLMPMHGENDGVSPDKPFNWDLEARKPTEVRDGSGVEVSEGLQASLCAVLCSVLSLSLCVCVCVCVCVCACV